MKNEIKSVNINQVKVNDRHRKDLGDIQSLADSIEQIGLLHPIVITSGNRLIAGERRLAAFKLLNERAEKGERAKWVYIPATYAENMEDALNLLKAEQDENTCRKDFAPSEAVAIGLQLEEMERPAAKARQGTRTDLNIVENFHNVGKTRDKVGAGIGMSGKTYEKAKKVIEYAQTVAMPELIALMDNKGVEAATKQLKTAKRLAERKKIADAGAKIKPSDRWHVYHGDIKTWEAPRQYDFIITDPPYPKEYLPLYSVMAKRAAEWLKPGGLLVAMSAHYYMNDIYRMMDEHLHYFWTASYLVPGESAGVFQKHINTQWKPLIMYERKDEGYKGRAFADVFKSDKNEKDHHKWGQSVSGMLDIVSKIASPGQYILDPFCGAGTTGIATLKHGCFFDGLELDIENVNISKGRIEKEIESSGN